MTTPPLDLAARVRAAYEQFAMVRQRFDRPGVERGGCPRAGLTPVFVRKFGEHAATIFPKLNAVEASFDAEQLRAVTATLLLLKSTVNGSSAPVSLGDRICDAYINHTRPYFLAALLQATEAMLAAFINAHPEHAPVLDAIFCVAGSEGLRDLVRLYDARVLERVCAGETVSFPDILAFVNVHERVTGYEEQTQHYEVWCPGYDLAKAYHQQCLQAAHTLVSQHPVPYVPSLPEEVALLPVDLVRHLTTLVRHMTVRIIDEYTPTH